MTKLYLIGGAAMLAFATGSAQATVTICDGNCAPFSDNVLITANSTPATAQTGSAGGATVRFASDEAILAQSNGQARIEAEDGVLNSISFELLDGYSFTSGVWNLFNATGDTSVTITYFDKVKGQLVDETFDLSANGQNFMGISGDAGEYFTKIVFDFAGGGVADLRQLRLGGIAQIVPLAVPEPGIWTMMIAGMGIVGMTLRRRTAVLSFS